MVIMHKLNNKTNNNWPKELPTFLKEWISRNADDPRIAIFLGAGASIPSGISGLGGLLSELKQKAKKYGMDDLVEYLEQINDVEQALTFLQILDAIDKFNLFNLVRLRKVRSLKHHKAIHKDFKQLFDDEVLVDMFKAEPNVIHTSIAEFIAKSNINVSIVTTNYDCCMEKALFRKNIGIITHISEQPVINDGAKVVELIKIHGSINWYYCPYCLNVEEKDIDKICCLLRTDNALLKFRCLRCGSLLKRLVILPYYFKIPLPEMIKVLQRFDEILQNSNLLIIIGYSFPPTDEYLKRIFSKAFINENKYVIIINPDEKVRETLKMFSDRIPSFKNRYLYLPHKADDVIDKILHTILEIYRNFKKIKD
jgi:NAD-dependent SIR2 family protein deacetylase